MNLKIKKIISQILILLILTSFAILVPAVESPVVKMNDVTLSSGETDTATLIATNFNEPVGSCEVTLSWNPSVVDVVNIDELQNSSENSSDFDILFCYKNEDLGELSITAYSNTNLTGDFCIAEIEFEAVGAAGDSCALILEIDLLNSDPSPTNISHDTKNGVASIDGNDSDDPPDNGGGGSGGGGGTPFVPPTDNPPVADASLSETYGFVNADIAFDGSNSTDDNGISLFEWDFDDGETSTGETISHRFDASGTYQVTLTVTDTNDVTDTDTINVTIVQSGNYPPTKPTITGSTSGQKNINYEFIVQSTDNDNDTIKYHINWDDGTEETTEFYEQNTPVRLNHTWTTAGRYTITVTADDNNTTSESKEYIILIDAKDLYYEETYLGYVTDTDGDGTYDTLDGSEDNVFYSQDEQRYLLDNNDDGQWDYTFDEQTESIIEYQESSGSNDEKDQMSTGDNSMLLLLVIGLVIVGIIILLVQTGKFKK